MNSIRRGEKLCEVLEVMEQDDDLAKELDCEVKATSSIKEDSRQPLKKIMKNNTVNQEKKKSKVGPSRPLEDEKGDEGSSAPKANIAKEVKSERVFSFQ
uniref:Uncharacterized protein n=1 Tax=Cucumis melo TaxID=3656 RepID=A0A9I9DSG1_CUCME